VLGFAGAFAYERATRYRSPPPIEPIEAPPPLEVEAFNDLNLELGPLGRLL
jgi:hypothetical protein